MWVFSSFRLLLKLPSRFDGTAASFKERQRLSLSVKEIGLIILNEYWSYLYFLSSYFVHRRKICHLYVTGYMYIFITLKIELILFNLRRSIKAIYWAIKFKSTFQSKISWLYLLCISIIPWYIFIKDMIIFLSYPRI